jgi:MerR family transcriptional regulator, thiopeptide resistance regulator
VTYRINEFAKMAGVTVRALRHYDRLGLLEPGRSARGQRLYVEADLERLAQIVALKYVGLPLWQIKQVLERRAPLAELLRVQQELLRDRRAEIDRALDAIDRVTMAGGTSDMPALRRLIEATSVPSDIDVMKRYYSDDAWAKWKSYYESVPAGVLELLTEIEGKLDLPPGSGEAEALVQRWHACWLGITGGDWAIYRGLMRAWEDRQNWPPSIRSRASIGRWEKVLRFLGEAGWALMAKTCAASSSRFAIPFTGCESRIGFFQDVGHAMDGDPAGPQGQALADRWNAILDSEAAGDPDRRARLLHSWRSRRDWPGHMQGWVAGLYMMSPERWAAAGDFLDRAAGARV